MTQENTEKFQVAHTGNKQEHFTVPENHCVSESFNFSGKKQEHFNNDRPFCIVETFDANHPSCNPFFRFTEGVKVSFSAKDVGGSDIEEFCVYIIANNVSALLIKTPANTTLPSGNYIAVFTKRGHIPQRVDFSVASEDKQVTATLSASASQPHEEVIGTFYPYVNGSNKAFISLYTNYRSVPVELSFIAQGAVDDTIYVEVFSETNTLIGEYFWNKKEIPPYTNEDPLGTASGEKQLIAINGAPAKAKLEPLQFAVFSVKNLIGPSTMNGSIKIKSSK